MPHATDALPQVRLPDRHVQLPTATTEPSFRQARKHSVMSVHPIELAATVCRSIMRELDDKPIRMMLGNGIVGISYERTSARRAFDQWTVELIPLQEFVTVRAQSRYMAFGLYEYLDIAEEKNQNGNLHCCYVKFLEGFESNPSLIIGDEYVAKLRAVVDHGVELVEADYARATEASRT